MTIKIKWVSGVFDGLEDSIDALLLQGHGQVKRNLHLNCQCVLDGLEDHIVALLLQVHGQVKGNLHQYNNQNKEVYRGLEGRVHATHIRR